MFASKLNNAIALLLADVMYSEFNHLTGYLENNFNALSLLVTGKSEFVPHKKYEKKPGQLKLAPNWKVQPSYC